MKHTTRKKIGINKVALVAAQAPLATQKEIAELTGLSLGTVNKNMQLLESEGRKDEKILHITDTDLQIVRLGQEEIRKRLSDARELEKMRTIEIAMTIEKSEKRYQIFRGEVTDKNGGLKNIQLTDEEKDQMRALLF